MRGNVYTRQKCWLCDGNLIHDEQRGGCFCTQHPQVAANKKFYVKFGRDINRRFPAYKPAIRFLTGIRFKSDEGTYDVRDYQASNPLGFSNLAAGYVRYKEAMGLASIGHIRGYILRAAEYFGDRNVKTIKKIDIRMFLYSIEGIGEKTRANYKSTLHDFLVNYLVDESEILRTAPKFPVISFELGDRAICDPATLQAILDEIYRTTYHINPKIWLGLDMLATYGHIRPDDLRRIREVDIDVKSGYISIERPTKFRQTGMSKKLVRLVDEHLDLISELKNECPALAPTPFFRHVETRWVRADMPFGEKFFYKQWKKACGALGIEGLDLYGGTRHTMTTAIAIAEGTEAAREFNQNMTSKAFERYCQAQSDRAFRMAKIARNLRGESVVNINNNGQRGAPRAHHAKGAGKNVK